jgi:hypothetical protein
MVGSSALLVIVIVPVSGAPAVGLNITVIVVLCPALSAIGRWGPEAVNPAPVTEIPEIVTIALPVFVRVTVFALLWPTAKLPKLIELGESPSEIVGLPVPAPLPVTPTHPDVTRIAARTQIAENPRKTD